MAIAGPSRKSYPSDLTDAHWAIWAPLIPSPQTPRGGHPRPVDLREVVHTLLYLNRSGCHWEMVPHDVLPKSSGDDYFAQWRDHGTWPKLLRVLRARGRREAGRAPTPRAACIASQAGKTTEMGGQDRG